MWDFSRIIFKFVIENNPGEANKKYWTFVAWFKAEKTLRRAAISVLYIYLHVNRNFSNYHQEIKNNITLTAIIVFLNYSYMP